MNRVAVPLFGRFASTGAFVLTSVLGAAFTLCAPLHASVILYSVGLDANVQQVPPNVSPGTGHATLTLDTVGQTLVVALSYSGLLAPATNAHIHCCAPPGTNAGVVIPFVVPGGFVVGSTSGSMNTTFLLDSTLVADILSGQSYVNIHTTLFPGGEIRGNITADTQVPEPAAMGLMGAALAGLVLLRRKGQYTV
jgi:hypothetical protein